MKLALHIQRLLALLAVLHRVACLPTNSVFVGDGSRPVVRIAYLYNQAEFFTPAKFMANHMLNHTFLPDYDIQIDGYAFVEYTGDVNVQVTTILGGDTPTYHAIAGPWGKADVSFTVPNTAQARILQISKGDNAEFNLQKEKYPYAFRVLRALTGIIRAWFYICASNDWTSVITAWQESETLEASFVIAEQYNVTNFGLVVANGAEWERDAWQTTIINRIKSHRHRVVLTYMDVEILVELACKIYRLPIVGMQWFTQGAYTPGWWAYDYSDTVNVDCDGDERYRSISGHVLTVHIPVAPGVNLFGVLQIPFVDYDQSQIPLGCMEDINPDLYFHSGEHLAMGIADGAIYDTASGQRYLANSCSETDQICTSLFGLHDFIYRKGFTLDDVESRDPAAFEALVDSTRHVDFQGPAGFFRYYNNTGDPVVIYYALSQYAVPWTRNDSAEVTAMLTYPDGTDNQPVITLVDEHVPIVWKDGSSTLGPKPEIGFWPRCGDTNAILVWDRCVPCPAGTKYDVLVDDCRLCDAGTYQGQEASSECITALPGTYISNVSNPIDATPCPIGKECSQIATVTPKECPPGEFANATGKAECDFCPVGRYQSEPAQPDCLPCGIEGSTTANIASMSAEACICPTGTYKPLDASGCIACPEGMTCPEGSDMKNWDAAAKAVIGPFPELEFGYMSLASEPLTVYLCLREVHCPGGYPGDCAPFRDSFAVACGDCVPEAYESGEECEPCGDGMALPFVSASILGVMFVIAATIAINRDVHKTPAASLMIVALGGLLFTSLQALGVFSQMSIPWVEPVKSVLRMSQLLSFDLKLLQVACVMGVNPVRSFAVRQSVAVVAIPCIGLTLLAKKYMPRWGRRKTRVAVELANSVGTLYSVFFISIVISALNPYICYQHPGESGESVVSAPSLLCFDSDDHNSMIAIGSVALFVVPFPFLALCTVGILRYPSAINSQDSNGFLHAMRFLFFRYTPKRYYFGIFILLRSLLLCLIPAILRGQAATQVLFMCLVLCIYILIEEETRPWRATLCNPLDAGMTMMLLMMLICGALFLKDTPQKAAVSALSTIIIVGLLAVSSAGISYAVWRRFVPRPYYNFFLCHHKAHAAAQARLLKIYLHAKKNVEVFIDSDNLKELDGLFDIVKSRVGHLVIILTSDTLKRPWCAGEIVTALRARLTITRLETPSWAPPSEESLEEPDTYVDTVGCNLHEYGIQWDDVSQAFRLLLASVPILHLSEKATGRRRFDLAAHQLLKHRVHDDKVPNIREVAEESVLVSTFMESDEANAAGGILINGIAQDVFRVCEQGIFLLADYDHGNDMGDIMRLTRRASAVVVILSAGCLTSQPFVTVICELIRAQESLPAPCAISVNITGFEFPAPAKLDALFEIMPELTGTFGVSVSEYVRAFFKRISILLPTHASQQALDTQSEEVFRRIHAHIKSKSGIINGTHLGRGSECAMAGSPSNAHSRQATQTNTKSTTKTSVSSTADLVIEKRAGDRTPPAPEEVDAEPNVMRASAFNLHGQLVGDSGKPARWFDEV